MRTLGQRIRELREAKDLSLRELAKQVGNLSAAFLSDVELGRRYPSDSVLASMAKALGTSIDDLRKFDSRAPVDEIKQRSTTDPAFGFALRKLVDKDISPEDLMRFLDKQPGRRKKRP